MNNGQELYCQLVGTESGFFSTKVTIEVDMGQNQTWFERWGGNPLKDEDGSIIKFNSMVDALNHMSKDGWLFINAYAITTDKNNIYHYLMRKKVKES